MKKLLWAVIIISGLALILALAALLFLRSTLPKRSGTLTLPGLKREVQVFFDRYGVPHIFAHNEHDLFFAQGYLHAQDRLFQMDLMRRAAWGRLSEVVGSETMEADRFARTLGFGRIAEEGLRKLDAEERAILEAYSAGVNAFIEQGPLPVEFRILRYTPELWEPAHSLAMLVLMSFDLNTSWKGDYVYALLRQELPDSLFQDLIPAGVPYDTLLYRRFREGLTAFIERGEALQSFLGFGRMAGSNAWVVSGGKSATGKPILCNDPHLGYRAPGIFYEQGLHGGRYDLYGVTVPGVPLVLIGRTPAIAWGLTSLALDDGDYYLERIPQEEPIRYEYRGEKRPITFLYDTLRVKGAPPVPLTLRFTHHGPIVSELRGDTLQYAYHWYAVGPGEAFRALSRIPLATNFAEFREALRGVKGPGLNVLYADTAGNIGYQAVGAVPRRPKKLYIYPLDGSSGEGEFREFLSLDELPHTLNPLEGFLATSNNAVVGPDFPYYLSIYWEPPSRFLRVKEFLSQHIRFTPKLMAGLQIDRYDLLARDLHQRLLSAIFRMRTPWEKPLYGQAATVLKMWNGVTDPDQPGPTVFYAFLRQLLEGLFLPHMKPETFRAFLSLWNLPPLLAWRITGQMQAPWYDDPQTEEVETRDDLFLRAFRKGVDRLASELGDSPEAWTWGKVHRVLMPHPFHERLGVFDIAGDPLPGSPFTVNKQEWKWDREDFLSTHGPAMRMIVQLLHPDSTWFVLATGESGNPVDRHYRDQFRLWKVGGYHPAPLTREGVEKIARTRLLLRPPGTGR